MQLCITAYALPLNPNFNRRHSQHPSLVFQALLLSPHSKHAFNDWLTEQHFGLERSQIKPEVRQFLFLLVEESIARGDGEIAVERLQRKKHLLALKSINRVDENNRLTGKAYVDYLESFESLPVPVEISNLLHNLHLSDLTFKRIDKRFARIFDPLEVNGRAFPEHNTIFVRPDAGLRTWYHEIAHLLFRLLCTQKVADLCRKAEPYCFIHSGGLVRGTEDFLPGEYLCIGSALYSLAHSGGSDGRADEIWAHLFALSRTGDLVSSELRMAVEDVFSSLTEDSDSDEGER